MDGDVRTGRPDETVDGILGGRLRIIQQARGYRFSLDALLLAAFADLRTGEDLIDVGTGSGVVALILADRHRCGKVLGVEIQEKLALMARRNAVINGLAGSVEIRQGDVRLPATICPPGSFDVAVFNPPYRRLGSGRTNRDPEKAVARHEIAGDAGDFLAFAGYALREGGRICTIYPAKRMAGLLYRMRAAAIEPKRMRIVHSRAGAPGMFALIEGMKGGGEELTVLPPLFIYQGCGGYTAEMSFIMRTLSASRPDGGG